jgi:hypothetical protein
MERVKGIEPSSSAWKAVALPLSYTRLIRLPSFGSIPWLACQGVAARSFIPPPVFVLRTSPRQSSLLCSENWWRGLDSNQRRRSQRIYSPSPLATRAPLRNNFPNWNKLLRASHRSVQERVRSGRNERGYAPFGGLAADRGLLVNCGRVSIDYYRAKGQNLTPRQELAGGG